MPYSSCYANGLCTYIAQCQQHTQRSTLHVYNDTVNGTQLKKLMQSIIIGPECSVTSKLTYAHNPSEAATCVVQNKLLYLSGPSRYYAQSYLPNADVDSGALHICMQGSHVHCYSS